MKMKKVTINDYTKKKIEHIGDSKRFVLLRGSIGVGKTLIAKELAKIIVKDDYGFNQEFNDEVWKEQVAVVPFHSGTDYENLIYGLKLTTENKNLKYNATEQVVLNMLSKASADKENKKKYVVILDDVNRGNFAGAMGDVLSAVESDDVGNAIRPGNDKTYTIPENLYIIATFNPTISNPAIDYAWLRRFMVVDIFSDENYIDSLDNIRERNRFDNFFKETDEQRFTDYIFEIYMEIKILFERYFLDNDENVRKQYMIGHGLFMTYDENITPNDKSQTYKENAKKFSYQLRYCIVPLLYQYVKDGLLDEKAKLDIEAYEHFYDEGYQEFLPIDKIKNYMEGNPPKSDKRVNLDTVRIYDLFSLIKALINGYKDMPRAALYKFFFHNASMMMKPRAFYFDTEDIKNDKENEGLFNDKKIQIKSGDEKAVLYLPKHLNQSKKGKDTYEGMYYKEIYYKHIKEFQLSNDKSYSPYYVSQQIIKWFLRAYEFNCCVNDHEYNEKDIYKFLVKINNCNDKKNITQNNVNKNLNKRLDKTLNLIFYDGFKTSEQQS